MSQDHVDVAVVGGCGHVGLPLGLSFAECGLQVALYDIDASAVAQVNQGVMPFAEPGASELLRKLQGERLIATTSPEVLEVADTVVVVIGTPVDEHLNPHPTAVVNAIESLATHLRDGQLIVLRSTVYPGTTAVVAKTLEALGLRVSLAFCPERIAEGHAIREIRELPQIVSSSDETGFRRAADLFSVLTSEIVRLSPEEAELAKLFTNTWRYIKFATANQLFMMATDFGLDYETIREGLGRHYPRAADLPRAGFAAGPCLLKDTMQLAAFNNNNFILGHAAMMVNEGLPLYVVSKLENRYKISELSIGILGMAFKEESDDIRSSLSYKLKRILSFKAREVNCTDPYVRDDKSLMPLADVIDRSDLLILAAPHHEYLSLSVDVPFIDIWGARGRAQRLVTPRVSIIVTAYNEGDGILEYLGRVVEAVSLPFELLVVCDSPDDSTIPFVEEFTLRDDRVRLALNTYGAGPSWAIRYGMDQAVANVAVVTMADGCDDPMQIDTLARLVERGVVIAAASRYMRGGRQIGGPPVKSLLSRLAGLSLHAFGRVGTRDATNSFKAYSLPFVREVGIESEAGFEVGIELVAKARRLRRPVAEVPTIWLERDYGESHFNLWKWLPKYIRWYFYAFGVGAKTGTPSETH